MKNLLLTFLLLSTTLLISCNNDDEIIRTEEDEDQAGSVGRAPSCTDVLFHGSYDGRFPDTCNPSRSGLHGDPTVHPHHRNNGDQQKVLY